MIDMPRPVGDDLHHPTSEAVPDEDLGASLAELQPESQGDAPLDAELGPDGQGDVLPEDEPVDDHDNAPDDLRVEDLP